MGHDDGLVFGIHHVSGLSLTGGGREPERSSDGLPSDKWKDV